MLMTVYFVYFWCFTMIYFSEKKQYILKIMFSIGNQNCSEKFLVFGILIDCCPMPQKYLCYCTCNSDSENKTASHCP